MNVTNEICQDALITFCAMLKQVEPDLTYEAGGSWPLIQCCLNYYIFIENCWFYDYLLIRLAF